MRRMGKCSSPGSMTPPKTAVVTGLSSGGVVQGSVELVAGAGAFPLVLVDRAHRADGEGEVDVPGLSARGQICAREELAPGDAELARGAIDAPNDLVRR